MMINMTADEIAKRFLRPTPAELVDLLRRCAGKNEDVCAECHYCNRDDCGGDLMSDAADALAAELAPRI